MLCGVIKDRITESCFPKNAAELLEGWVIKAWYFCICSDSHERHTHGSFLFFSGKNHIPLWKSVKRHSNIKRSDRSVPRRIPLAAFLCCLWGPCALSSSPSPLHWFLLLLSACLFSVALSLYGVYRRQQLMQDLFSKKARFSNWFVSSVTNSSQTLLIKKQSWFKAEYIE